MATQRSTPNSPKPERNAPWWIKAFVVFHIIAITIWALPNPPPAYASGELKLGIDSNAPGGTVGSMARLLTDGLLVWKVKYGRPSFFKYYTLGTGFWQYWDMFSPNPINYDVYCTADIVYEDGSKGVYHYPRMYDLDVFNKYAKERYRKFFERVAITSYLWPSFAQRIAVLVEQADHKKVQSVTLWSHRQNIPPPDQPMPTGYNDFDFFRSERVGETWHNFNHTDKGWSEVFYH